MPTFGSVAAWSLALLIAWCGATIGGTAQAPTSMAPSRVLVVYNANAGDEDGNGVQDSLQVANYYASKRGVPAANLLGLGITLNFGPIRYDVTEYGRFYSEMIQPIRNKLQELGPTNIDVILLCYGVPYNLGSDTSGTGFVAIDNVLMALNNWSPTTNNVERLNNPYIATSPTFETDRPAFTHDSYKISGQEMYMVSRLDGMSALRAQNLVDQALYAERYLAVGNGLFNGNVYVDNRFGPYTDAQLSANSAVTSGSYGNNASADANIAYAEHYVAGTGLALKWENTGGSLSIGQPGAQYHDGTSALTAPRALMYGGWYNAAQYFDVYEWLPGAVACDLNSVSMSSIREGFGWGSAALARGASAVCGVLGEPLLSGHPRPNILLYYMLKGYTFAETSTLATRRVGWMAINIGDPLYAPFKPRPVTVDTSFPAIAPGYPRVRTAVDTAARIIEVRLDDAVEPETARILIDYGLTTAYGATADPGQGFYRSAAIMVSGLQSGTVYHYRVRMIDPVGNTSTSGDFTFSTGGVPPPPPDASPSVALTQPGPGSSVSGSVSLAANASDDVGVVRVEFLVDGALVASDLSAPYLANWISTAVANGAHSIAARAVDTAGNASTSAATAITVANGGANPPPGGDEIWVGDALPAGAVAVANGGDNWSWISANPTPQSGALAHASALAGGMHQHYFHSAQTTMSVAGGDTLIAYVYLDPASPPSEVMLQWYDGSWNAGAYWGANVISFGVDGTPSRRYMGPLPAAGQWVRLEVPAVTVGLEGHAVNGMAFTLFGGRATWDHAGRRGAATPPPPPPGGDEIWVGDALPAGAVAVANGGDNWSWISANPTPQSGALAHASALAGGMHQHYFHSAQTTMSVAGGDTLIAYVYLDPASPPSEVMLQWYDGSWNAGAYWGANVISFGVDGTPSRRYMGPLPAAGQWVRLEVPAATVGLEGHAVNGMAFTLFGGRATWDHAGRRGAATPPPPPPGGDEIWVGDALPAGAVAVANGGDNWSWISANPTPQSGALAHASALAGGMHQHYFHSAQTTMSVAGGDTLIAYVYLDPASPPSEVMLQWYDGSWNAGAYWGANVISFGVDGTPSRRYMGPLPAAGQWVRLEVPAATVGLEGHAVNGMAFTLFGGRATWDHAGRRGAATPPPPPPGGDEIWVGDALPAGAVAVANGGDNWSWISANPTPQSGALAHASALAGGMHQHYFHSAQTTMSVAGGDTLIAYVYLDPASPPSEVMLQWYDGSWNAGAYWGANVISFGVDGTPSRRYMGPLPAAGQWVRLEVPAVTVGLEGRVVNGMAFTLFGGRATWDHAGKTTSIAATNLNVQARFDYRHRSGDAAPPVATSIGFRGAYNARRRGTHP